MQLRYKDKVLGGSSNVPTTNPTSEQLINAPIGAIMGWTDPDNIPQGWHICDGTEGTYDLRGKFILGASEDHAVGETGGSEEVTLTTAQMPKHHHGGKTKRGSFDSTKTLYGLTKITSATDDNSNISTTDTGSSEPHPNMPPYIALIFIQKIGVTPTDYVTEERMEEAIAGIEIPPAMEIYSTEEIIIGRWLDKVLYRKTFHGQTMSSNNYSYFGDGENVEDVVNYCGWVYNSVGDKVALPNIYITAGYVPSKNKFAVFSNDSVCANKQITISFDYTKIAD